MSNLANPFSGPPFSLPPGATFNNQPLPSSAAYFFDTYGNAMETLGEIKDWIVSQGGSLFTLATLPAGAAALDVVDGINSGDYGQVGLPGPAPVAPYDLTTVWLWLIKGNFMMPQGLCFENDLAGLIERRSIFPNVPNDFGDKNTVQIGNGQFSHRVGVATSLALQIAPESPASLATAYYVAP